MAPVLTPAGFKRRGRWFTLENEFGDRASVEVRSFALGYRAAEFHITLHILPKVWRDWITREGGDSWVGLWMSRLSPRGRDIWSMDLGDDGAARELTESLTDSVPGFLYYLDFENLFNYARQPTDPITRVPLGVAVMPLLLAVWGPSEELEQRLAAISASRPDAWPGFDAQGFVDFVRAWMADNPPRPRR